MHSGYVTAIIVGAISLGALGARIGIAGFFGGISGLIPLALIGAYIGHKIYKGLLPQTRRPHLSQIRPMIFRRGLSSYASSALPRGLR